MKKAILLSLLLLACAAVFAAWSTDPLAPNLVAGFTGEQVIPKVAVSTSGNTYICRFDNSGGGYRVYLQLLGLDGTPVWTDPLGLLVSNHTQMSWITDYDMDVDNDGNAVIVFQDIRTAGVNNVVAYKISPQGEFLWGADGLALSSDTDSNYSNMVPVVFNSADNTTYAAWQRDASSTNIVMNRISATGQKLWGENGITISPLSGSYSWPQIIQSDGDNVLLKYYHDTGNFPALTRHVYVAKYDTTGQRLWNSVITNAGGYTAWQQTIPFEPDGTGGAVLAWYEDRDNNWDNDVYCQRVTAAGAVTMGEDGALISQDTANQQYYPQLAVDTANQMVYAFYRVTDANQNLNGLGRQLLDYNGVRQWGAAGTMEIPLSSVYVNTAGAYYTAQGGICFYEYAEIVYAGCWRASGAMGWVDGVTEISLLGGTKDDFNFDTHPDAWSVLAWSQGMTDTDIYAMRLNSTGSLGTQYLPPQNLTVSLLPPDTAELTWVPPSAYIIPLAYIVYMDDQFVQTVGADITSIQIAGLSAGEHSFYMYALYEGNNYSLQSETVTLIVVSVDDPVLIPGLNNIRVFPNPCREHLAVSFVSAKAGTPYSMSIYNLRGQRVWRESGTAQPGTNSLQLDSALALLRESGVYFLKVEYAGSSKTSKIVRVK